jgi:hypothetical protein
LDWERLPFFFVDQPIRHSRALLLKVIASRDSEFVVAGGAIEIRAKAKRSKWVKIDLAKGLLKLPLAVPANRAVEKDISGRVLAEHVKHANPSATSARLRVRLYDLHRTTIISERLEITLADLTLEKWS